MELVVTSGQMRSCDRYAIRKLGIPAGLLMENAGRRVAEVAVRLSGSDRGLPVVVICGKGNNAGDGLVAARHLLTLGRTVDVVMVFGAKDLRGETKMNFSILQKMSRERAVAGRFRLLEGISPRGVAKLRRGGVVIDALFGTGFRGKVSGTSKKLVEWINRQPSKVVSVDIPSGLDADNGTVGNVAVKADITVTMGLRKTGLVTGRGPSQCGQVHLAGLGYAPRTVPEAGSATTNIVRFEDFRSVVPRRPFDAHKHSVGKILVIAGSVGLTGAAALTATAAMKTGAGAVILAVPPLIYPILARKLTEVMVKPFGASRDGSFTVGAMERMGPELGWADVVIVGPGLGRGRNITQFMKELLRIDGKRFLIDADALNTLAATKGLLRRISANECILTPHTGELSRLTGKNAKFIGNNRVDVARDFGRRHSTHIVLKGAPSVTGSPNGEVFINSSGNEGMASAGMGDVLSGIIGAFWGESKSAKESAYAGVYLHGLAGDRAAEKLGKRPVMATDVMNEIPYILSNVAG